jgi:Major Facilitator Superfamily
VAGLAGTVRRDLYDLVTPKQLRARAARGGASLRASVARTVVLLGVCSLLTDVSSEMVSTILPVYLVVSLGFSPLQFGVVDGLYQGASALVRLGAGFAGDRMRRYRPVAIFGYGISAFAKLGLATVGSAFGALSSIILADRIGKGIRTAPRDAMISLATPPERLGLAFGVHRAMDSAGAMLGPLVAFGLLTAAPSSYRTLFLVSFFVAILGLAVLVLLVEEPKGKEPVEEPPDLRAAFALLTQPRFRALTITASVLGLATVSDSFVALLLFDHIGFRESLFPLLATGIAGSYMLLAVPAGRLAYRYGRWRMFMGGYALLLGVYVVLLLPSVGTLALIAVLALLGGYYAATDGVLAALGSV